MPYKDPEQKRLNGATYYANHREEFRVKGIEYRATHREAIRIRRAVYRASHKELKRIAAVRFRAKHRVELKAKYKIYQISHREIGALRTARYDARKLSLPDTLTIAQWDAIKKAYGFRCAYCGVKPQMLTQDHVIPLFQGGGTTPDNIVPACLHCNKSKGPRPPVTIPALRLLL